MKTITLSIVLIVLAASTLSLPLENGLKVNPEVVANEFEGDIVLSNSRTGRSGLLDITRKWPKNSKGQVVVPYLISNGYSASEKSLIISAINEIQEKTCIKFMQRTTEADYIEIASKNGCSSSVGRVGGKQTVSLAGSTSSAHCMIKGIIIHEVLHALGFYHMHSSMDRDNYVKINYGNVIWGLSYAFSKYTSSNYGTSYDLESVMHYDPYYFTSNGKPTIEPLNQAYLTNKLMGQRKGLSPGDIIRINNMYQC